MATIHIGRRPQSTDSNHTSTILNGIHGITGTTTGTGATASLRARRRPQSARTNDHDNTSNKPTKSKVKVKRLNLTQINKHSRKQHYLTHGESAKRAITVSANNLPNDTLLFVNGLLSNTNTNINSSNTKHSTKQDHKKNRDNKNRKHDGDVDEDTWLSMIQRTHPANQPVMLPPSRATMTTITAVDRGLVSHNNGVDKVSTGAVVYGKSPRYLQHLKYHKELAMSHSSFFKRRRPLSAPSVRVENGYESKYVTVL